MDVVVLSHKKLAIFHYATQLSHSKSIAMIVLQICVYLGGFIQFVTHLVPLVLFINIFNTHTGQPLGPFPSGSFPLRITFL